MPLKPITSKPMTKSIEQLQAEIAELKAAKATQAEAPQAEAPQQNESMQNKMDRHYDIEIARVRGWAYFVGAYISGPIFPAIIANRTKVWTPFWVGLGLGVASLPLAALDLGILSSIPAAAAGTAMMAKKSEEKRRKLNVVSPEQADLLRFKNF